VLDTRRTWRRRRVGAWGAVALVLLVGSLTARGQQPPQAPRVKALLISSGAFHDYLYQTRVFVEAIGTAVPVDWTIALQGSRNGTTTRYPIYDRPDWASGFDIVVHNECSADVGDPDFIRRITRAHRSATVPAMVIHCAMHSYRSATVDDWREFLGVTSRVHTPQFTIPVRWTADPIVSGLPADWVTPMDELYVIERLWPGARPLASAVDYRDQQAHPVAWVHETGGVRVFGTTLGHGNATWDDPVYQQLLVRGFRWAIGREPVPVVPGR
jgi:hypothetical protein